MEYYLSVDQGGSKTEALIFNQSGEILAFADDRDIRVPGESYASMQGTWLRRAAEKALAKAGLSLGGLSGACCALNGADWASDYSRLRKLVSSELALDEQKIRIVNDCVGAMRGGADGGNQAVLCLGTGMNCAVKAADGREHIFGYFVTSIDQGGSALGNRAWLSILDSFNGLGPQTMLTELLLEKYGSSDFYDLFPQITSGKVGFQIYELSPLLMRAAVLRDGVALEILEQMGSRLVRYIEEGAKRLGISDERITLVLTGGAFKGDGVVFFDTIQRVFHEKKRQVICVHPNYEPVAGAALLILDELEEPARGAALARFEAGAGRFSVTRKREERENEDTLQQKE